jgi:hypothetical protein
MRYSRQAACCVENVSSKLRCIASSRLRKKVSSRLSRKVAVSSYRMRWQVSSRKEQQQRRKISAESGGR